MYDLSTELYSGILAAGLLDWPVPVAALPEPWVVVLLWPAAGICVPLTGEVVRLVVDVPTVPVAVVPVPVVASVLLLDDTVPEVAEAPEALPPAQRVDIVLGLSLLP